MAVAHAKHQVTLSQLIAFNEDTNAQLVEIKAQTEGDGTTRILTDVIVPGDPAAVLRKFKGYDLDRQRAIIDVLLTVTGLPGQGRGELRTDLLPITWKGEEPGLGRFHRPPGFRLPARFIGVHSQCERSARLRGRKVS